MEYKYIVRFAHVNEEAADITGGIHHGPGEMEITTYEPVETQQQRDDVAAIVGRAMHKKHGVTGIAVQAIIPVDDAQNVLDERQVVDNSEHKVIDAADFPGDDE